MVMVPLRLVLCAPPLPELPPSLRVTVRARVVAVPLTVGSSEELEIAQLPHERLHRGGGGVGVEGDDEGGGAAPAKVPMVVPL